MPVAVPGLAMVIALTTALITSLLMALVMAPGRHLAVAVAASLAPGSRGHREALPYAAVQAGTVVHGKGVPL